jgi:hypothetical protein
MNKYKRLSQGTWGMHSTVVGTNAFQSVDRLSFPQFDSQKKVTSLKSSPSDRHYRSKDLMSKDLSKDKMPFQPNLKFLIKYNRSMIVNP